MTQPKRGEAIELLAAISLMKHAAIDQVMEVEHLAALAEFLED